MTSVWRLGHERHIYIYAFSRRFYPKRLTVHLGYTFFVSMCSLGIEPTTFALLTQCSTTEPQDQRPKVGLPSHSAPQPLLEASVVTTFLLCAVSRITPCFSQKGSLQWARADTQARVTVTWWLPWRQAADGTLCFSQNWSRPNWSTGKAAALRPSIFWKALSRRVVPSLSWLVPLRPLLSSALSR